MNNNIVDEQIRIIGQFIETTIKNKKIRKSVLAEHCGVSVNTLGSLLKGKNTNFGTVLTVLNSLGYTFVDVAEEIAQTSSYTMPTPGPMEYEETSEMDVDAVRAHSEETNDDSTSFRLGTSTEELPSVTHVEVSV